MNITFVVSSLRLSGGVILIIEISNRLIMRGHNVTLLTPCGTTDSEISQKIHRDIVVCEAIASLPSSPNIFEQAYLAAALVWNTPTCDVLVATHTPTTLPVLLSSWWRSAKRLWLFMDYPEMFRSRPMEQFLLTYMPRCFSSIVAISRPLADEVASRSSGEIDIIRPGLGLMVTGDGATQRRESRDAWRILYVGDDRPRKGLQEFVRAMEDVQRICPSMLAVIVCKNACRITSDIFHEIHIRPDNTALAALYQECDVFVSTSWGEGLGYPPLQAMAFGKPTIVADSGGVRDYVVDGINALLVPAQDVKAVADALLKLISDEPLRNRLGANGQQTAAEYDWEKAVDQFDSVLQRLIRA